MLEYSIDDFAIAQLAHRLGDDKAYDFFSGRSQNWMNVFDPQTGALMPRSRNGFDRTFDLRVRDDAAAGDSSTRPPVTSTAGWSRRTCRR